MDYISVAQAAQKLGISERTVRDRCRKGLIRGAFMTGKTWNVPAEAEKISKKEDREAQLRYVKLLTDERKSGATGGTYGRFRAEFTFSEIKRRPDAPDEEIIKELLLSGTVNTKNAPVSAEAITEAINVSACVDLVFETYGTAITEKYLKELHRRLCVNTADSRKDWIRIGEYKAVPTSVTDKGSVLPEDVKEELTRLISSYKRKRNVTEKTLRSFASEFIRISPFQTKNEMISDLIMLKESLKNGIPPSCSESDGRTNGTESLLNNAIPILEFDGSESAVIEPDHEKLCVRLPEKCVFAFLGEYVDEYAKVSSARTVAEFVSATKIFPVYEISRNGQAFVLCQAPVGAAAAAQLLDWLIGYGVKRVISVGSCGALTEFSEGEFVIPSKALRDEGASYHYAPPSRYAETDEGIRKALKEALSEKGFAYAEAMTWSTDGFYRETREKVLRRRAEGCAVVEMECSALAACAGFRGAEFASLLYTADTLSDVDGYDERNWGEHIRKTALELCAEAILKL